MNFKWVALIFFVLVFSGCASTYDFPAHTREVYERISAMKPQFAECWRNHQPDESADALTSLTLEGSLQTNGRFRYMDVSSVPQATKSTQACIEKLATDEQFHEEKMSTTMTFELKY
jgi:hypothetical protein